MTFRKKMPFYIAVTAILVVSPIFTDTVFAIVDFGNPFANLPVPTVTIITNAPTGGTQAGQSGNTTTTLAEKVEIDNVTVVSRPTGSISGTQTGSAFGIGLAAPSGGTDARITTTATVSGDPVPGSSGNNIAGPTDSNGNYTYLDNVTVDCGAGVTTYAIAGSGSTFNVNSSFTNNDCTVTYNYAPYGGTGAGTDNDDPSTTPGNDATFLSASMYDTWLNTLPWTTTLNPGQSYMIGLTFRNSGTSNWNASTNTDVSTCPSHNGYSLHSIGSHDWNVTDQVGISPQAKNIIDLEEYVSGSWQEKSVVSPGEVHTFFMRITAPTIPGTYPFQWRMHENCKSDFDQSSTLINFTVANTVSIPNLRVHVPDITSDPTGSNSGRVLRGQSYDLSWAPTNPSGTTCTASGSWSGSKSASGGSENRLADAQTAGTNTYTLACTRSGITNSETTTVEVLDMLPCDPFAIGVNKLTGCLYAWDPGVAWPGYTPNWDNPGWLLHSQAPDGPSISGTPSSGSLLDEDFGTSGPNGITDRFMILWRGSFNNFNGAYNLTSGSNDGHYLVVNPGLSGVYTLVSPSGEWSDHTYRTVSTSGTGLPSGQNELYFSVYDNTGDARFSLDFQRVATPTADIKANGSDNPPTIPYGGSATFTWTSTDATSCSVSPTSWTGTSGNQTLNNLTTSRTYTLTCVNGSLSAQDSVDIDIGSPPDHTINVIKAGQGTVTSSPSGINCGGDCTEDFAQDTDLTMTATPAVGRIFVGWGGLCAASGSNPVCNFTVSNAGTIYAYFAVDPTFKEF